MSDVTDGVPEVVAKPKRHSFVVDVLIRLIREKPLGTAGGVIVLVMFFAGIFADLSWLGLPDIGLAPYGSNEIHMADHLDPPSTQYWFGTDSLGRDQLSRIIYGARISMIVGVFGSLITTLTAIIIGGVSGFFGGKIDIVMQRFVDAFLCFPWLFLSLTIMVIVGSGLIQVIVVLGWMFGMWYSRVIRSAVIAIRGNVYMEASQAVGCSNWRMISRHIMPNVAAPILIVFTISMAYVILSEATLSFLGFGIPPPDPSWGGMLSGKTRHYMTVAPWMAIFPGLTLAITVYGINVLGDAVRDVLDPRLRGGLGRYGGVKRK